MGSVDDIKSKLDIVDVVESYVSLTHSGANFKARCPFHNERTPSFSVSSDRQMYYCFGCGAGGDVVDFVERIEGVDFHGAMKILADRAGIPFEGENTQQRDAKERLHEITETACLYFQSRFADRPDVHGYLAGRGVSDASMDVWRIGYAPDEWRALYDHLSTKGWSEADIVAAGLGKQSKGGRVYDTFRDRIIFPILDTAGRVIAFSGRSVQERDDVPKYLNSPDTPIFHKSSVLYGLDRAKHAIRSMGFSVLVEGQMDLILSHQRGFQNTVATSGTAVTQEHLTRLNRLSSNLMLAFDADSAGVAAVQKSAVIALSLGMDVKVAVTPEGKDPADMLSKEAKEWKRVLSEARPVVLFLLEWVQGTAGGDAHKLARSVNQEVLPYVAAVRQRSEQSYFIKQIASVTGIREDALWDDLAQVRSAVADRSDASTQPQEVPPAAETESDQKASRQQLIARHIAGVIVWQESKGGDALLDVAELRKRFAETVGDEDAQAYADAVKGDQQFLFDIEEHYSEQPPRERDIDELFQQLTIERLAGERDELTKQLADAETEGNAEKVRKLMSDVQQVQAHIDQLRGSRHND